LNTFAVAVSVIDVAFLAADTTFTTGQDFLLDGGIAGVRIVR